MKVKNSLEELIQVQYRGKGPHTELKSVKSGDEIEIYPGKGAPVSLIIADDGDGKESEDDRSDVEVKKPGDG